MSTKEMILDKIEHLSHQELEEVVRMLEDVERRRSNASFIQLLSGSWADMNAETFENLTSRLHQQRAEAGRQNSFDA